MNIYVYILSMGFICGLYAMDTQQLFQSPSSNLMNSSCTYDFGLKNDYQVNWSSDETKAFIQAFEKQRIQVNTQNKCIYFYTNDNFSYFYSMQAAQNKFEIMKINIVSGKMHEHDKLRYLFLNEDINYSFDICSSIYRDRIIDFADGDEKHAEWIWIQLCKQLRKNRRQLTIAFAAGDALQLKGILQKPLFIEHIDLAYVKNLCIQQKIFSNKVYE